MQGPSSPAGVDAMRPFGPSAQRLRHEVWWLERGPLLSLPSTPTEDASIADGAYRIRLARTELGLGLGLEEPSGVRLPCLCGAERRCHASVMNARSCRVRCVASRCQPRAPGCAGKGSCTYALLVRCCCVVQSCNVFVTTVADWQAAAIASSGQRGCVQPGDLVTHVNGEVGSAEHWGR